MTNFICLRCGKSFHHKGTFVRHLNNIKVCLPILSDKTIKDIKKYYLINDNISKIFRCPYCNQILKTDFFLINHIKNICDKSNNQIKKDLEINKLKNEINNLKIKNKILNKKRQDNITIKSFFDNIDRKINENILEESINNPVNGITSIISYLYFNKDYPEYNNIKLSNKKKIYIDIYNGTYWEAKEKSNIIHNLIIQIKDIIDDYYENNEITYKNNYKSFSDKIDNHITFLINKKIKLNKEEKINKEVYGQLYKSVEILMINAQRILKI